MTKEEEKTIEIVAKYLNFNEICGTRNFKEALETVLNMLKEKDKEIEKKKKSLDNLENELNRLSERNLELFEESFEAQKKNEYWESRIKQGKKDVKGLKLYEIGIVCEDLKEEIEKKDKIIDLMAEYINHLSDELVQTTGRNELEFCNGNKCCKDSEYSCEQCIKQYYERKSKE